MEPDFLFVLKSMMEIMEEIMEEVTFSVEMDGSMELNNVMITTKSTVMDAAMSV